MGGWAAWGVGRPRASGLHGPPTGEPVQLPRRAALRAACLRGRDPLVPVVEATYPTMGVYGSGACRAQVHGTKHRRVLLDPEMHPIPVVVRQVLAEQPPKMLVVENDDEHHLARLAHEYVAFFNLRRAHQGIAQRTPVGSATASAVGEVIAHHP